MEWGVVTKERNPPTNTGEDVLPRSEGEGAAGRMLCEPLRVIAKAMTHRSECCCCEALQRDTGPCRVKGWGDRLVACTLHRRRRTVAPGARPEPLTQTPLATLWRRYGEALPPHAVRHQGRVPGGCGQ